MLYRYHPHPNTRLNYGSFWRKFWQIACQQTVAIGALKRVKFPPWTLRVCVPLRNPHFSPQKTTNTKMAEKVRLFTIEEFN